MRKCIKVDKEFVFKKVNYLEFIYSFLNVSLLLDYNSNIDFV